MPFQIPKFKSHFVTKKTTIWFFVVTVMVVSDSLMAQNPLRAQTTEHSVPGSTSVPNSILTAQQPQRAPAHQPQRAPAHQPPVARQLNNNRIVPDQISSQEQLAAHTQNIAGDIEQTTYRSPTGRDRQFDSRQFNEQAQRSQFSSLMNDDSTVASSAKMNFIQRDNLQSTQPAENSGKPEQQNLGQLISKLGMNLAFVLFLAIGGVLAAKQWIKPGSPAMRKTSTSAKTETPSMQIIDTLRIDSKTTLRLIECDDSRVLVATDAAGIKSVNLLTPSFDHALLNDVEAFEKTEPQRAVQSDSFEEGATPKRGPKHTSYAPTINKSKPTPTIYQPPRENATTSTHTSKESSDGMDEKLIRMLLENSKKRHVAK